MTPTVGVIICAAGKGLRAGFTENKLFAPLNGKTVLENTLSAFDFEKIDEIILTASENDFTKMQEIAKKYSRTQVVLGGETRFHSVHGALQQVKSDIVLIHDGARPFVTRQLIEGCIQSVKEYGSGICAIPCTDTIAVKATTNEIIRIPDRNLLVQIQTPQGVYTKELVTAYQKALEEGKLYDLSYTDQNNQTFTKTVQTKTAPQYTDDSSVYCDFIKYPHLCEGSSKNKKLTYAEDFTETARCGFGVDTHAFGKAQDYILLAGVKIPSESGLIAHSDGDVLVHAVMDALLSAAGLKDIGHYFPDTDEKWKNASSMQMLALVMEMLKENGYAVQNLSIAVQAEKPRLAKYIDEMKNSLSGVLKIDPTAIGITAGTNEGLGYVGEGKGITVNAYTLLKKVN